MGMKKKSFFLAMTVALILSTAAGCGSRNTADGKDVKAPVLNSQPAVVRTEVGLYDGLSHDLAMLDVVDDVTLRVEVYPLSISFGEEIRALTEKTSSVFLQEPGTYTVRFGMRDEAGNEAEGSYQIIADDTERTPVFDVPDVLAVWRDKDGKAQLPTVNVIHDAPVTVTAEVLDGEKTIPVENGAFAAEEKAYTVRYTAADDRNRSSQREVTLLVNPVGVINQFNTAGEERLWGYETRTGGGMMYLESAADEMEAICGEYFYCGDWSGQKTLHLIMQNNKAADAVVQIRVMSGGEWKELPAFKLDGAPVNDELTKVISELRDYTVELGNIQKAEGIALAVQCPGGVGVAVDCITVDDADTSVVMSRAVSETKELGEKGSFRTQLSIGEPEPGQNAVSYLLNSSARANVQIGLVYDSAVVYIRSTLEAGENNLARIPTLEDANAAGALREIVIYNMENYPITIGLSNVEYTTLNDIDRFCVNGDKTFAFAYGDTFYTPDPVLLDSRYYSDLAIALYRRNVKVRDLSVGEVLYNEKNTSGTLESGSIYELRYTYKDAVSGQTKQLSYPLITMKHTLSVTLDVPVLFQGDEADIKVNPDSEIFTEEQLQQAAVSSFYREKGKKTWIPFEQFSAEKSKIYELSYVVELDGFRSEKRFEKFVHQDPHTVDFETEPAAVKGQAVLYSDVSDFYMNERFLFDGGYYDKNLNAYSTDTEISTDWSVSGKQSYRVQHNIPGWGGFRVAAEMTEEPVNAVRFWANASVGQTTQLSLLCDQGWVYSDRFEMQAGVHQYTLYLEREDVTHVTAFTMQMIGGITVYLDDVEIRYIDRLSMTHPEYPDVLDISKGIVLERPVLHSDIFTDEELANAAWSCTYTLDGAQAGEIVPENGTYTLCLTKGGYVTVTWTARVGGESVSYSVRFAAGVVPFNVDVRTGRLNDTVTIMPPVYGEEVDASKCSSKVYWRLGDGEWTETRVGGKLKLSEVGVYALRYTVEYPMTDSLTIYGEQIFRIYVPEKDVLWHFEDSDPWYGAKPYDYDAAVITSVVEEKEDGSHWLAISASPNFDSWRGITAKSEDGIRTWVSTWARTNKIIFTLTADRSMRELTFWIRTDRSEEYKTIEVKKGENLVELTMDKPFERLYTIIVMMPAGKDTIYIDDIRNGSDAVPKPSSPPRGEGVFEDFENDLPAGAGFYAPDTLPRIEELDDGNHVLVGQYSVSGIGWLGVKDADYDLGGEVQKLQITVKQSNSRPVAMNAGDFWIDTDVGGLYPVEVERGGNVYTLTFARKFTRVKAFAAAISSGMGIVHMDNIRVYNDPFTVITPALNSGKVGVLYTVTLPIVPENATNVSYLVKYRVKGAKDWNELKPADGIYSFTPNTEGYYEMYFQVVGTVGEEQYTYEKIMEFRVKTRNADPEVVIDFADGDISNVQSPTGSFEVIERDGRKCLTAFSGAGDWVYLKNLAYSNDSTIETVIVELANDAALTTESVYFYTDAGEFYPRSMTREGNVYRFTFNKFFTRINEIGLELKPGVPLVIKEVRAKGNPFPVLAPALGSGLKGEEYAIALPTVSENAQNVSYTVKYRLKDTQAWNDVIPVSGSYAFTPDTEGMYEIRYQVAGEVNGQKYTAEIIVEFRVKTRNTNSEVVIDFADGDISNVHSPTGSFETIECDGRKCLTAFSGAGDWVYLKNLAYCVGSPIETVIVEIANDATLTENSVYIYTDAGGLYPSAMTREGNVYSFTFNKTFTRINEIDLELKPGVPLVIKEVRAKVNPFPVFAPALTSGVNGESYTIELPEVPENAQNVTYGVKYRLKGTQEWNNVTPIGGSYAFTPETAGTYEIQYQVAGEVGGQQYTAEITAELLIKAPSLDTDLIISFADGDISRVSSPTASFEIVESEDGKWLSVFSGAGDWVYLNNLKYTVETPINTLLAELKSDAVITSDSIYLYTDAGNFYASNVVYENGLYRFTFDESFTQVDSIGLLVNPSVPLGIKQIRGYKNPFCVTEPELTDGTAGESYTIPLPAVPEAASNVTYAVKYRVKNTAQWYSAAEVDGIYTFTPADAGDYQISYLITGTISGQTYTWEKILDLTVVPGKAPEVPEEDGNLIRDFANGQTDNISSATASIEIVEQDGIKWLCASVEEGDWVYLENLDYSGEKPIKAIEVEMKTGGTITAESVWLETSAGSFYAVNVTNEGDLFRFEFKNAFERVDKIGLLVDPNTTLLVKQVKVYVNPFELTDPQMPDGKAGQVYTIPLPTVPDTAVNVAYEIQYRLKGGEQWNTVTAVDGTYSFTPNSVGMYEVCYTVTGTVGDKNYTSSKTLQFRVADPYMIVDFENGLPEGSAYYSSICVPMIGQENGNSYLQGATGASDWLGFKDANCDLGGVVGKVKVTIMQENAAELTKDDFWLVTDTAGSLYPSSVEKNGDVYTLTFDTTFTVIKTFAVQIKSGMGNVKMDELALCGPAQVADPVLSGGKIGQKYQVVLPSVQADEIIICYRVKAAADWITITPVDGTYSFTPEVAGGYEISYLLKADGQILYEKILEITAVDSDIITDFESGLPAGASYYSTICSPTIIEEEGNHFLRGQTGAGDWLGFQGADCALGETVTAIQVTIKQGTEVALTKNDFWLVTDTSGSLYPVSVEKNGNVYTLRFANGFTTLKTFIVQIQASMGVVSIDDLTVCRE